VPARPSGIWGQNRDADKRTWYVVLAFDDERLGHWRPSGVEFTTTPVRRLWGPGSWDELRVEITHSASTWPTDSVEILDRHFYIRVRGDQIDVPRSAEHARGLRDRDRNERWLVVRADGPGDAMAHARDAVGDYTQSKARATNAQLKEWYPWHDATPSTATSAMLVPTLHPPRRHKE